MVIFFLSLSLSASAVFTFRNFSLYQCHYFYEMAIVHCEVKEWPVGVFLQVLIIATTSNEGLKCKLKRPFCPDMRNAASIFIIERGGEEITSENTGQKPEIPSQAFSGHTD